MPPKTPRVFVVDNEPVIAETLTITLNHFEFIATAFNCPESAIAAAILETPDVLLTDIFLPGMTGIDLAVHFRERYPGCKILLFSGLSSKVDKLQEANERVCLRMHVEAAETCALAKKAAASLMHHRWSG